MRKICKEWAEKNKVDLSIDFITSNGDKLLLTIAAEAQAKSGHDILSIPTWYAAAQADNLVPMDDVMKTLIANNGKVSDAAEYLGKQNGKWVAVPGVWGNATFPCVGRFDLLKEHAGLDVIKMYPATGEPDKELAEQLDLGHFSVDRREDEQGRISVRRADERGERRDQLGRLGIPGLWLRASRQGRQYHGQVRCHKAGARLV